MKERGIILAHELAGLAYTGELTQLRFVAQKTMKLKDPDVCDFYTDGVIDDRQNFFKYPYGCIGDRIWIRESFRPESMVYKADGDRTAPRFGVGGWLAPGEMPRWASRTTMDITEVRLQRLHDMTEEDAAAMGSDILEIRTLWDRTVPKIEHRYHTNPLTWVYDLEII
jgi:hypothetical protein